MTLHFHSTIKTNYPFLAHPPPQKNRPQQPLPSSPSASNTTQTIRRRSSTFSAIAAWAAHVQPGSPTSLSPCSPHRRPSLGRSRRPSATSICAVSASFLHITPTPTTAHITTPSVRDFKADLTALGYTSVFLQLPNTPISPTLSVKSPSPSAIKKISVPTVSSPIHKPRSFTRFRSLSVLRSRGKSKSVCPVPTTMKAKAAAASAAIVKRKKAKYGTRPPPLANELALLQFADGGCMEDNIKRIMEAQAKATGAVGLADVHRGSDGGVWFDQDEEWEYAHLLAERDESRPPAAVDPQWVTFGDNTSLSTAPIPGDERRGSVSTQDSDLDPKHIVQPVDLLDGDDLALFGSAVLPLVTLKPGMSVLSLPSRPRRTAKHLRKPNFLVDVTFSCLHASLKSPKFPISPGVGVMKTKGKARRRPAPLKLSPPSPAFKWPTNSPIDPDKIRQDFIEASFEPVPVSVPMTPSMPATAVSASTLVNVLPRPADTSRTINAPRRTVNDGLMSLGMKTKPSMLNMMALFRSGKKEDVM